MRTVPVPVFVGLGSNLDEPAKQLDQALAALHKLPKSQLKKVSSYYQTGAVGPAGQPDYLNAVVLLMTQLSAEALLDHLQQIENAQGRVRKEKWGARTLDLDILLYGNDIIQTERLTVPHEHMLDRNFVLLPLSEIAGEDFVIPGHGMLITALQACPENPIKKWNSHQI